MRSGRLGLSSIDKREIWSRWKAGRTLHEIGRVFGKCHNTIRAVLLPHGGIPPVARIFFHFNPSLSRSRYDTQFAEPWWMKRKKVSTSLRTRLPDK